MNTTPNNDKIPVMRELDGIYFRVERDGKWCNRCFSDLTVTEREKVLEDYDVDGAKRMCCIITDALRRLGDELNVKCCEPVMEDKDILSETEVLEDVYLMVYKDRETQQNDAVMVWNTDGDLEGAADEILTANAEHRKPENKTDTMTIELSMELMAVAEQWCIDKKITLEQFFYAFVEFCVQPKHQAKVDEVMRGLKNE